MQYMKLPFPVRAATFFLFSFVLRMAGMAAPFIIDEFNITQGLSVYNYGYQAGSPSFGGYDQPNDALGGSRSLFVQIDNTSNAPFDFVHGAIANGDSYRSHLSSSRLPGIEGQFSATRTSRYSCP